MSAPVIIKIVWDGIAVEVSYRENYHRDIGLAHIELRVEKGRIIPITETGYRSHFLHTCVVDEYGGPEAYVRAWLDNEAQSPEWNKRKDAARQMSFFD